MVPAFPYSWNASEYDSGNSFVSKYGEDVVALLDPGPGERILDLGCGTGTLTHLIQSREANVTGIDASEEMISQARKSYPEMDFICLPAQNYHADNTYDAIFSNAALHWMLDVEQTIERMYANLHRGGRLVAEMGGRGNVASIHDALKSNLEKRNIHGLEQSLWYFPSLGEYTTLLEKAGFRVVYAVHFNRPTELSDPQNGIKDWVRMFGRNFLVGQNETQQEELLDDVQNELRPILFRGGKWYADYRRLRFIAIKE